MTFILTSIPTLSDSSLSPQTVGTCPSMPDVWSSAGFCKWPWTRVAFCLMWLVRCCFNICCLTFLVWNMWVVVVSAPRVVLGTKRVSQSLEQPSACGPLATGQRLCGYRSLQPPGFHELWMNGLIVWTPRNAPEMLQENRSPNVHLWKCVMLSKPLKNQENNSTRKAKRQRESRRRPLCPSTFDCSLVPSLLCSTTSRQNCGNI